MLVSGLQVGVWLALLHQMEYHESEVCDLDIGPEESSFLQLKLLTDRSDIDFQVLKSHSIVKHQLQGLAESIEQIVDQQVHVLVFR